MRPPRLAADEISPQQFTALDALRGEIGPHPVDQGPLALADREDELSVWLSRRGVAREWVIAPPQLPGTVTVVRDYGPGVPRIGAYPGELNQVWTNLIANALDAMNGSGTLRLTIRAEQGDVVVEVCDTGPGMSPQVAARAFDAFYTTKDTGQGTGLGLDIARRTVVERHGGGIDIDSRPGNTVLRVRLPARGPGRARDAG